MSDQRDDPDVYPMPAFTRLACTDLDESAEWFETVAGFETVFSMPGLSHLRYRRYADVLLAPASGDEQVGSGGATLCFNVVDETVADVAERAHDADWPGVDGPTETAWNTREVTLTSPDGYDLTFSEPVDTSRDFDEVMGLDGE
ncbi:VOC family protein [Haloarchaeobius sp. DFWS5]|uniref:VOC family protein n=1 Tax=Haloarchaeobius sp. DFWS5 TaxID=3446114 RepID=UPI003EBC4524